MVLECPVLFGISLPWELFADPPEVMLSTCRNYTAKKGKAAYALGLLHIEVTMTGSPS